MKNNSAQKPAYRIESERLVIRCYHPRDASLLGQVVGESIDHLLPWMPWVKEEPVSLKDRINLIRGFRARFDTDVDYPLGIFSKDEKNQYGGTGLHLRVGPNACEIGYFIGVKYINQGYATESVKALVKVAFEINEYERVEIHCDPRNTASANIPKKLGFLHEGTLRDRNKTYKDESRDSMIWSMLKDEYTQSNIGQIEVSVYDVLGREFKF